ncbi:MAG: D-alanyl-D-alanine carboxypeptidase, partial [Thermomicrobiales bacterium]|nr:D-alanyl-D-alanine carboxypeptidase [Thermomicrobiales bacterium]
KGTRSLPVSGWLVYWRVRWVHPRIVMGNKGLCVRLSRRALGAIMMASALSGRGRNLARAAEVKILQPPAPSSITARGVYVFDRQSGVPLFARDADLPLPPASLTKIIAAMVVLDRADLDQMITIVEGDLVSPEESQVGLIAGDVLSVRDLLFGALIPSGNDATLALARTVGVADLGDGATDDEAIARFVALMNEKAAAIGATSTHLVYPTGVDREGHVMSARDVATASAAALENPLFAEIVGTTSATLPSQVRPEGYEIFTTNDLLVEGLVNGVKTGSTPQAGGCLATSFDLGPGQIVAVVLGCAFTEDAEGFPDYSQRFADSRTLMSAAESGFVWLDLTAPGTLDGLTEELAVWDVALPGQIQVPVAVGDASSLRYRLRLAPPDNTERGPGELDVFVGDALLLSQPTVIASQVIS